MASIAFRNARLIDSISDQPRDGMSIVVEGERISAVGSAEIPAPGNATVVDLKGQTVLPGLIDTHVHTTMMDQESLPLFLAAGVTSARDVGGKLEKVLQLRSDLNRGAQLGPRLFVLGPLLDGTDASLDGPFAEMLDSVPSVDAVPEKIGGLLKAGVDGIKIYFSMPPDTVRAVIKFVDKRVPITAHLGYTHSLDAIHAGIDGLEHVLISPFNEFCAVGCNLVSAPRCSTRPSFRNSSKDGKRPISGRRVRATGSAPWSTSRSTWAQRLISCGSPNSASMRPVATPTANLSRRWRSGVNSRWRLILASAPIGT